MRLSRLGRAKLPSLFHVIQSFLISQNYIVILAVILLVVAIRLPIDYKRIMTDTANDYGSHIYFALDMLAGRSVQAFTLAHSLWQLILIFIWWLSRCTIDFWQSAIGLQVFSSVVSALIIYFWYGALPEKPSAWIRAFWAVSLVIVAPVIVPFLLDGKYYFGYLGLANYHNPTIHVLRPFALIMLISAKEVINSSRHSFWFILLSAAACAGATFLKPSYTITLLPALGLIVLYQMIQHKPVDWMLLIFGLGLPAVLFLAPQFVITYISGEPDGGIAFMPFVVAKILSDFLLVKFLLSVFFPLVMLIVHFSSMRRDMAAILSWLSFGMGAAQFYLLAEKGSRFEHGNFLWSAQISLFILFVVTIRHLLKQGYAIKTLTMPRTWIPYMAYLPHLLSGIAYYIYCFTSYSYG
jgi:hypothetical protein